jgi:hypothetical protein
MVERLALLGQFPVSFAEIRGQEEVLQGRSIRPIAVYFFDHEMFNERGRAEGCADAPIKAGCATPESE